jgi:hypothetical protein
MPDPLKFQIEVGADTQGAEDTKAAVEEVRDATVEANKVTADSAKSAKESASVIEQHYKDLEERAKAAAEQFGKVTPSPEGIRGFELLSDEAKKALTGITQGTDGVTLSQGRLRSALQGVGRVFPELGALARAAFHPLTLLITATIIAVTKAIEGFKEMGRVLSLPVWKDSSETWKAYDSGLAQANASAQLFQFTLRGVADTNALLQKAADDVTASLQRQQNAQMAIRNAEQALELARIDALARLAPEKGGISEVEAIERKLAAQKRFAAEESASEKRNRDEQAETLRRRIEADEFNKQILRERLSLADENFAKATAGDNAAVERQKTLQKNIEEQTKKVKELQDASAGVGPGPHPIYAINKANIQERLVGETAVLDSLQQQIAAITQTVQQRAQEKAEAEHVRQALQSQTNALQTATEQHEKQLDALVRINTELDKQSKKLDEINGKRREVEAGSARGEAIERITPGAKAAGVSAAEIFATEGVSQVQAVAQAIKGQGVPASEESMRIVIDAFREAAGTVKLSTEQQKQFEGWVRQEVSVIKGQLGNRGGN